MSPTIVLISGANRGLGRGLLQRFLAKPDHIVIAANRDPAHPTSQALSGLLKGEGSHLIVAKIDASLEHDAFDTAKELQERHGIDHLDVVIANAGVSYTWPSVAELKLADLQTHMTTNAYGVVTLYQATRTLLQKSQREPMFIPIGSAAGCVGCVLFPTYDNISRGLDCADKDRSQPPIPNAAYGPTKAVVNWLTVRINAEDDWLNAFVLAPGLVDTDLGLAGARWLGIEAYMIGLDESCDGMMQVIATSTKEKHGGKMALYNGEISSW